MSRSVAMDYDTLRNRETPYMRIYTKPEPLVHGEQAWQDITACFTGRASFTWAARDELQWRLNVGLQGTDPGLPVNWRGMR